MNENTEDELVSIVISLNILSSNDDLTAEEKDRLYNLYGHVQEEMKELLDTDEYDPEKLV